MKLTNLLNVSNNATVMQRHILDYLRTPCIFLIWDLKIKYITKILSEFAICMHSVKFRENLLVTHYIVTYNLRLKFGKLLKLYNANDKDMECILNDINFMTINENVNIEVV